MKNVMVEMLSKEQKKRSLSVEVFWPILKLYTD